VFGYGTDDLTLLTRGSSRDDIGGVLPDDLDTNTLAVDPCRVPIARLAASHAEINRRRAGAHPSAGCARDAGARSVLWHSCRSDGSDDPATAIV